MPTSLSPGVSPLSPLMASLVRDSRPGSLRPSITGPRRPALAKQLWTPLAAHRQEERAQGWLACPGGLGADKASREVRGPLPCDRGQEWVLLVMAREALLALTWGKLLTDSFCLLWS